MRHRIAKRESRMVKCVTGILALVIGVFSICGCNQQPVAVEEKPDEAGLWQTDYDAALKQAAAENKYVLVDFSGSDWCGWCIKLDEEVFSQPEFTAYAKENLICVLIDFPKSKPQSDEQKNANKALAENYKIQGFPTVLILNPQGEAIKRDGYQRGGAANYIEFIKSIIAADQKQ